MEFQLSYFKSWKMMLWKCCTQYASILENSAVATALEKVSFQYNPKTSNTKECSKYCTIALTSCASKVTLKILQASLQQYMKQELLDVQTGFITGRGTRTQLANIRWIIKKKQESSRKTSISALLTLPKLLTVWVKTNCGKFWKRWEYQTTWPASWEICMQVKKQ